MKCVHPTASGGVSHKPRNFYGDTLNIVGQYEAHDIPTHSTHTYHTQKTVFIKAL
jgi:hypothetical protein